MANYTTAVRNTSGETYTWAGQTLYPNEEFDIDHRILARWREDLTISGSILTGDLEVGNGTTWFTGNPEAALRHFFGREEQLNIVGNEYITITSGDGYIHLATNDEAIITNIVTPAVVPAVVEELVSSSGVIQPLIAPAIIGGGTVTVASGTNAITVSGSDHANPLDKVGELYQLMFVHEGSDSKDRWLGHHGDTSLTSDRSPAVVPWDSKLVAITYTNRDNNSDIDLEIYSVHETDTTQKDVEFVWNLRDARVARRTNFSPDVLFDAGDRVAVYARGKGVNPDYVVFTMYLQVTEDNNEEVVRMFSGDLSVGGTPETDS